MQYLLQSSNVTNVAQRVVTIYSRFVHELKSWLAMRRHLPSLKALRTFEAAARHSNLTRAAEELGVTQGAVSRQVRLLEDRLDVHLFTRVGKRVELTAEGRRYLGPLTRALNMIEAATIDVLATRGGSRVLKISTLPTFGMQWLVPRLASFRKQQPNILASMYTSNRPVDLVAENFDLAIRYGDGRWADVISELLLAEDIIPVCSPKLLKNKKPFSDPVKIFKHVLLHTVTRPAAWAEWCDCAGVELNVLPYGVEFEDFFMTVQGALAGLGIAILPRLLILDHLNCGSLVAAYPLAAPSKASYYLVGHPARWDDPAVTVFRQWIRNEASES